MRDELFKLTFGSPDGLVRTLDHPKYAWEDGWETPCQIFDAVPICVVREKCLERLEDSAAKTKGVIALESWYLQQIGDFSSGGSGNHHMLSLIFQSALSGKPQASFAHAVMKSLMRHVRAMNELRWPYHCTVCIRSLCGYVYRFGYEDEVREFFREILACMDKITPNRHLPAKLIEPIFWVIAKYRDRSFLPIIWQRQPDLSYIETMFGCDWPSEAELRLEAARVLVIKRLTEGCRTDVVG